MQDDNKKIDDHFKSSDKFNERYEMRKAKRAKNHEKRMIIRLIIICLALVLGFFIFKKLFGNKGPSIDDKGKAPGVSTSSQLDNSASDNESDLTSDKDPQAGQGGQTSENAGQNVDPTFAGDIQKNANTGSMVQDAKGKGKNHNQAANVYAYNVPDVKAAMYDGKKLADGKIAFLTYDDGVSAESTPLLLDELKRLGVPATFFMLGKSFNEDHKPILQRMMKEGHALAYHSFNHDYSDLYPGRHADTDEILKQFKDCRDALTPLIGPGFVSNVWRYPGGHMSWKELDAADKALEDEGVHWIDWNSLNSDAAGKGKMPSTTQGQVEEVLDSWRSFGSPDVICVLMHDTPAKELTRNSAEAIVKALRDEGFSFGILE